VITFPELSRKAGVQFLQGSSTHVAAPEQAALSHLPEQLTGLAQPLKPVPFEVMVVEVLDTALFDPLVEGLVSFVVFVVEVRVSPLEVPEDSPLELVWFAPD